MKIVFSLEEAELNKRLKRFSRKLVYGWFTFLEWLIISGLLFYLYAMDHRWYILLLGALSGGILSLYISTLTQSFFHRINKRTNLKNGMVLFVVLTLLSLVLVWCVITIIVPDLAMTYVK